MPPKAAPRTTQTPRGTRHKRRTPIGARGKNSTPTAVRPDASFLEEQLKQLPELIRDKFKCWPEGAQEFQLEGMKAQVMGQDVLIHAATGSGKTGIAAGPHLLECNTGKVTLMVSPLIALHEEQVTTFREEFGMKAIAINSAHGGCSKSRMKRIVAGEWQIVIVSPEMLQSRRFTENVLRRPEFGSRVLSVFIDEAHCVSHWGASFRKKYGTIGIIRAFLPKATPFVAVSATLTPRVRRDILQKLQFDPMRYVFINIGNDRTNVSQVVRAIQHPMNTYADLDFVVPSSTVQSSDIPKTFVYVDDIKTGSAIVDYLNSRVNPELRDMGLIRPYNAAMSRTYRTNAMALFKAGIIRVLVCTDAAGMGCNIPDIDIVVQWKAPLSLSAWVQRAGRAARGPGRTGLAILLVEKSAFELDPSAPSPTSSAHPSVDARGRGHGRGRGRGQSRGTRGGRGSSRGRGARMGNDYALLHGLRRGEHGREHDTVLVADEPTLSDDAPAEGLYVLVQTTRCRRAVLRKAFENGPSNSLQATCCDLCDPNLLDQVRPGMRPLSTRQSRLKKHEPYDFVREALYAWRRDIKKRHFASSLVAPHGLLNNETCELLASVAPIPTKAKLADILQSSWALWSRFGDQLFEVLAAMDISSLPEASNATRKRVNDTTHSHVTDAGPSPSESSSNPRKRLRPSPLSNEIIFANETLAGPSNMAAQMPSVSTSSDPNITPIAATVSSAVLTSCPFIVPSQHGQSSISVEEIEAYWFGMGWRPGETRQW